MFLTSFLVLLLVVGIEFTDAIKLKCPKSEYICKCPTLAPKSRLNQHYGLGSMKSWSHSCSTHGKCKKCQEGKLVKRLMILIS